jgi:hypothetical protein
MRGLVHLVQYRDQGAGPYERGNETSGYVKGGEFLD